MFGSIFDGFVEAVTKEVFNATSTETGIVSHAVNENATPSYIQQLITESIVTGRSFADLVQERATTNTYSSFANQFVEENLTGVTYALPADLGDFADKNLPTYLLGYVMPYGPTEGRTPFFRSSKGIRGKLRLRNWLLAYLGNTYHYEEHYNNLLKLTYQRNSWVSIKSGEIHLPGRAGDYSEEFREVGHSGNLFNSLYSLATGDTFQRQPEMFSWIYHPTTYTTIPGEPYNPPSLADPVVLQSDYYTPPELSAPIVLYDSEEDQVIPNPPISPYIKLELTWRTGGHNSGGAINTEIVNIPIPLEVLDPEEDYWQIVTNVSVYFGSSGYTVIQPNARNYTNNSLDVYWVYKDGSGQYPKWDNFVGNIDGSVSGELDARYVRPADPTTFIGNSSTDRVQRRTLIETDYTYNKWETQAKLLGMPPVATLEATKTGTNLDYARTSHYELGISMDTEDPILNRYVFALLEHWRIHFQNIPITDFDLPTQTSFIKIEPLKRTFYFSGIAKEIKAGKYSTDAKLGSITKTSGSFSETFTDTLKTGTFQGSWQGVKFYHQHAEDAYTILRVGNPLCVYDVRRDVTYGVYWNDERFVLPIHLDVIKTVGSLSFEHLLSNALRYTQVSAIVTEYNWRTSEFFQDLMKFVQIGSMVTFAIGGIHNLVVSYGMNVATATIVYAMISVGLQEVLEFAVEVLGIENSEILAVTLVVAGTIAGVSGADFLGSVDGLALIQIANGLVPAINELRMDEVRKSYEQLQYEQEEFGAFYDERIKEIDEARDLLGTQNYVSPYLFIGNVPLHIWGEEPQTFYERTIHSGNIGVKAFDLLHSYVSDNLRLPTFEDSVGDYMYGH